MTSLNSNTQPPRTDAEPLIKLDGEGRTTLVKYTLPEAGMIRGRHYMVLNVDISKFKPNAYLSYPVLRAENYQKEIDNSARLRELLKNSGLQDPSFFQTIINPPDILKAFNESQKKKKAPLKLQSDPQSLVQDQKSQTTALNDNLIKEMVHFLDNNNKKIIAYRSITGQMTSEIVPKSLYVKPELMIIERRALSIFCGDYGVGKVVNTFTLLPGEKAKISVTSYRKSEETRTESASILDSIAETNSTDIQRGFSAEKGSNTTDEEGFSYHAEAEAEAKWGFGKAKASGGIAGETNSLREECTKNVSNFVQNQAKESSSKRDVQINTNFSITKQTGTETSIERIVENVNVSRSLNFIFRQMNQEYISIMHLFDVRIAFFNGSAKKEVPISEMKELLSEYIVPEEINEIYKAVIDQLKSIKNHYNESESLVEEVNPQNIYHRVRKITSKMKDKEFSVPGIILDIFKTTVRTDGVIVESILGNGEALDKYSKELQNETIRAKKIENDAKQLALNIINGISDPKLQAEIYEKLLKPAASKPE